EREKAAQRQKILSNIVDEIRQSLEIENIFATATAEIRHLLKSDRAAIYRFNTDWSGAFVAESVAPGWPKLPQKCPVIEDTYLQTHQGGRYALGQSVAVNDIYSAGHQDCHLKLLEQCAAKAYAIAPILQKDKLWGLFAVYQNSAPRAWEAEEIDLLAQIGTQLGIAIQQAEYHQKVQDQASQLAIASEQKRSLERQRTLATTIDKIRQSLDIDTIFSTTTQETRQLLNVERVAIYRFLPDWSGEIVAESILPGWTSLLQQQPFIADTYLQETQGGRYRYNEYSVINDIDRAGYSECHVALLQDLNVRAYIIVPIFQGQNLWGLLAAYQNSTTRHWEAYEVEFLAQISLQLEIALQQAELLKQTQNQAQTLVQTLAELRHTQSHLIQNEKMAGLGQLVAGVAHEINNPINFVYGNLSYVEEYAQDLLSLIALYQECYPQPEILIPDSPESRVAAQANTIDLDFITNDLPKILNSMKIGTERIRQLVLSLRTFSRVDESHTKRVNIHDGIESTLLILQHRLKTRPDRTDVEITRNYGEIPPIECYAAQLNQVFMNILSNSIDALENIIHRPLLEIQTEVQGEQAIITIKDNGPGIAKSVKERIFDPFFTTKPVGKGTGLGLSISHQIIEKHQGKITCDSQLGRGTTFKITIPIR
ncbi:MAG: GAF domain-containing protein, partial [Spirulinaceae cyanobacterium]